MALGNGLFEVVREPSPVAGALALLGFVGFRERRKLKDLAQRLRGQVV